MYRVIGGYVYVANNPINLIDPDGRKIVPRNMTPEQEKQFYDGVKNISKNSFLFKALYNYLESSNTIHYIEIGYVDAGIKYASAGVFREGDDIVTRFSNSNDFDRRSLMAEEFFHAYQLNLNLNNSNINMEFEAKTFDILISQDFYSSDKGISKDYLNYFKINFKDEKQNGKFNKKMSEKLLNTFKSTDFLDFYNKEANKFSNYNKKNKYGTNEYMKENKGEPVNLQNFLEN